MIDVGSVSDFQEGEIKIIEAAEHHVGIVRWRDRFFAIRNRCPHQGGPLCEGTLAARLDGRKGGELLADWDTPVISCPWHGWEFDATGGRGIADPRYAVRTYAVELRDDRVFVDVRRRARS